MAKLESKINELSRILKVNDVSTMYEIVINTKSRVEKLRAKINELSILENEAKRLNDEIKNKEHKLKELSDELSKINMELSRFRELEFEYMRLSNELNDLRSKVSSFNELIKDKEVKIKEYEARIEEVRRDIKLLKDTWYKVSVLLWIRNNVFHRDSIPKILRRELIKRLEPLVNNYLEFFNINCSGVSIDDEFNVKVIYQGNELGIGRLSGGESIALSIALLLALHQVLFGGRVGFLILDEPTIFLDEERRKYLIEIFKKFRGGYLIPQLIVVTHHEEIRDAGDRVFEVYRDIYSRVRELSNAEVLSITKQF